MPSLPNVPKVSLTRNQIIMIGAVLAAVIVLGVLFVLGGSKGPKTPPFSLTVWGVDSEEEFSPLLAGYKAFRPNATVTYTQIPADSYQERVLTALAAGKGPDVFLIGNHDLLKRGDLLAPAPETQFTMARLDELFPRAVAQDLAYDNRIYALPLYMDTLALVYNKQMFDQAGIATPPQTWQEILDVIPRLRTIDTNGQIERAALAIGGSDKSVDYAADILSLVMLQNGTAMADDAGLPSFDRGAGPGAFRFYLQFADAGSSAYTWSDAQPRSIESFITQRTAMTFVYHRDLPTIKARSPFLDMGIIGAPQIAAAQAVNYPNYMAMGVWTGSKVKAGAWDFVVFSTTNATSQNSYLAATKRPPALRALIASASKDAEYGPFARAALTARSWKMGDYDKIKEIFSTAVQNVTSGAKNPEVALRDAVAQAGQLIRR